MASWKGKTRGGSFGYLFFIGLIKYLGITAAYTFLTLVVLYFIPFAPKATRSQWWYARHILQFNRLHSCCFLLRNYYRLGQILIDKAAIGNDMQKRYHFKFERYKEFLDILNGDQGAILISAHVGNWEIGAPFFDTYGKKMNVVMYDAEHQRIKEILEKNGKEKEFKIIPVNEDNLTHVFRINEALRNKEYVCFQGDRFVNEEKLLTTTFMGKEARFPAGPFLLASRMRVPVVFYFAMREKSRTYHFRFYPAELPARSRGSKPEQLLLEQYVKRLEEILAVYPEQWFNYYPFWETGK